MCVQIVFICGLQPGMGEDDVLSKVEQELLAQHLGCLMQRFIGMCGPLCGHFPCRLVGILWPFKSHAVLDVKRGR